MKNHTLRIRKIMAGLLTTAMILATAACGTPADNGTNEANGSTPSAPANIITVNGKSISLDDLSEEGRAYANMAQKVKILGRAYVKDETVWCSLSGSGIEFIYTGSHLDITLLGDGSIMSDNNSHVRYAVYLNDVRTIDDTVTKMTETITVVDEAAPVTVTVKIIKLSEAGYGNMGIAPIAVAEGESIEPTSSATHRIEFIGDSITCGYGVDDEVKEHHFSTLTEDVTKTYAYKVAQQMDADYSFFSFSGYGIISGYTSDSSTPQTESLVPQYYRNLSHSSFAMQGVDPDDVAWDFSLFQPDVIVVNLGTNDNSYCQRNSEKEAQFAKEYYSFLCEIRACNPNAAIFCVLGIMGQDLYKNVVEAADHFIEETGDTNVYTVLLDVQDQANGIAADWHPTEANHAIAADTVEHAIRAVIPW